jgi:hypothetical protein
MTKFLSACILFAAAGFPVSASSIASVSASLGSNTCSQSLPGSASCDVFGTANSPGGAYGMSLAPVLWGRFPFFSDIEVNIRAYGANANASASSSYSDQFRVTGVSGSGSILLAFSGFQIFTLALPGTSSVSPFSVSISSFSTAVTLPVNITHQLFFVTAPINFGTLTSFNVSLTATASSTAYSGAYVYNGGIAAISSPAFTVLDANGNIIPNASVEFIPEPATWFLLLWG